MNTRPDEGSPGGEAHPSGDGAVPGGPKGRGRVGSDLHSVIEALQQHQSAVQAHGETLERARCQLEASLARYTELYDGAPVGYLSLRQDGVILQANLSAARMFGVARAALVGRSLFEFFDPGARETATAFLERAFASWHVERSEFTIRLAHGGSRIVQIKSKLDRAGAECRVVLIDVTALRRTEARFNELARSIEQVFWVADCAITSFSYLSPHCTDVLGGDCRRLVVDRGLRARLVAVEDLAAVEDAIAAAREACPVEIEFRIRHPAKGLRWLGLRCFPFDGGGERVVAGLIEDVTERRNAEEARLARAVELREALVREVHHRIKNNLQTVVGLLRREAERHPEATEAIEAAIGQVRAVALVHGLSAAGVRQGLALCRLLPEIVMGVSGLHGAGLTTEARPADCEEGHRLLIRESESVAVALILNELVTNAVKHGVATGDGALRPPSVSLSREGARGRIRIVNSGQLPRGFDFASGSGLGTGLGLVRALMPQPGMSITFSREDGRVVVELHIEPPVVLLGEGAPEHCKGQNHEIRTDCR